MVRRVAVFTGSRAEYGLQVPILRAMGGDPRLEPLLIVSGAHLKDEFGRTEDEIARDGFHVHARVAIEHASDGLTGTAEMIGRTIVGLTRVLAEARPDVMLVYGDRFEGFAAVVAATQMGIPTAHVEGGDYTGGGALDDSVRHAMSKLAHIHFATNPESVERLVRLGEERERIHNVGLPALDLLRERRFAPADDVRLKFGLDPKRPTLLLTQHSVATEWQEAAAQIRPTLDAILEAGRRWGCQTIVTYPNDDAGGRAIIREIEALRQSAGDIVRVEPSLGRHNFHGVLAIASAILGNSSAGIKEAPALGCPAINIGPRQHGRLRAGNVLQVAYDREEILHAIDRALHDEAFRASVRDAPNPYGTGDAGARICEVLAAVPLDRALLQKRMTY